MPLTSQGHNKMKGTLSKLKSSLVKPIEYQLPVGDQLIDLNPLIGKKLTLTHTGNIFCSNCEKKTKKSYSQGHCFMCMHNNLNLTDPHHIN